MVYFAGLHLKARMLYLLKSPMAIEFFYAVTKAIFHLPNTLRRLKQLELEFADLLTLSSAVVKKKSTFAWRLGVLDPDLMSRDSPNRPWINPSSGSRALFSTAYLPA